MENEKKNLDEGMNQKKMEIHLHILQFTYFEKWFSHAFSCGKIKLRYLQVVKWKLQSIKLIGVLDMRHYAFEF